MAGYLGSEVGGPKRVSLEGGKWRKYTGFVRLVDTQNAVKQGHFTKR